MEESPARAVRRKVDRDWLGVTSASRARPPIALPKFRPKKIPARNPTRRRRILDYFANLELTRTAPPPGHNRKPLASRPLAQLSFFVRSRDRIMPLCDYPSIANPLPASAEYDPFNDSAAALRDADAPAAPPVRRFLIPNPSTFRNYTCCPWATSRIVRCPETSAPLLQPVTCKRWGCSFCAPRKIKRLAFLVKGAEPNRWCRLGVQPANYLTGENGESPAEVAWRETSPKVPELFRRLKSLYGECEYLRVCELHNGTTHYAELPSPGSALGFPHYHALMRSAYIPQPVMSRLWAHFTALPWPGFDALPAATAALAAEGRNVKKLQTLLNKANAEPTKLREAWDNASGAPVIWISKIDKSFSSFRYLTKYLTKLHRLEWTDRHVSYSRDFFRAEDREKISFAQRDLIEVSDLHPWKLLSDRFGLQSVGANPDGTYLLPDERDAFEADTPLSAFGLRIPEGGPRRDEQPAPPGTHRVQNLPGLEDSNRDLYDDQPF